jgi:hypothetical protein
MLLSQRRARIHCHRAHGTAARTARARPAARYRPFSVRRRPPAGHAQRSRLGAYQREPENVLVEVRQFPRGYRYAYRTSQAL